MEQAAARAIYSKLHAEGTGKSFHDGTFKNWGPERSKDTPYGAHEGVHIWVNDIDLEPDATWLSGTEEQPGDHE